MQTYDSKNYKDVPAPEPSDWIWDGILRSGEKRPSLVAGLPHAGKSTFAVQLAVTVVQGKPCLDRATKKSRVIFWRGEESAIDAKDELIHAGMREDDPLVLLIPDAEDDNLQCLSDALDAYPDTKLVIIETISDFLHFKDSNHPDKVKAQLTKLNDTIWERHPDCALLLLCHFNKSDMTVDSQSMTRISGAHTFAAGTASKIFLHCVSDQDQRRWIQVVTRKRGKGMDGTYLVYDKTTSTSTLGQTRWEERTLQKAQTREAREQDLTSKIVQAAAENPGLTKTALAEKVGGKRTTTLGQIDQLIARGILVVINGVSSHGGSQPQQIYVKGGEPKDPAMIATAEAQRIEELFANFEGAPKKKEFFHRLGPKDKALVWDKFKNDPLLRGGMIQ